MNRIKAGIFLLIFLAALSQSQARSRVRDDPVNNIALYPTNVDEFHRAKRVVQPQDLYIPNEVSEAIDFRNN
uniref:DUF3868 domain-containing protein n=1 Tax=Syphacia muris TaxID=451379 RepID=A0A0N5AN16_9BILA